MRGERSNPVRTHSKQPRLWGPCIADTTRNCFIPFGQISSLLVKSAISGRFHWVFITLTWTGRDTGRPGFRRAVYKSSIQVGVYKSEVSSRTQVASGCRRKSTFFEVAWRSTGHCHSAKSLPPLRCSACHQTGSCGGSIAIRPGGSYETVPARPENSNGTALRHPWNSIGSRQQCRGRSHLKGLNDR